MYDLINISQWEKVVIADLEDLDILPVPEGFSIAAVSTTGLAEGNARVTFIHNSQLLDESKNTTVYKTELETGDKSGGVMIVHPETFEILTWGDRKV